MSGLLARFAQSGSGRPWHRVLAMTGAWRTWCGRGVSPKWSMTTEPTGNLCLRCDHAWRQAEARVR